MTKVHLAIEAKDLKMLRETLCKISTGLANHYHITNLLREIDRHRPLGSDGKHGNLHTETCGCEDKE